MNKQEIAGKLTGNHQKFADFIAGLTEQDFMFAPVEKWSAGQQIEHIIRGVSPLATALTLPKFAPRLLFGKADHDSVDYETVVKNYHARLAAGGKASGRFIPPEVGFKERENLRDKLSKTVADLVKRMEKFTEAQLDEYVLPHPLLGKLTIREMLYFTIYHVEHHHKAALRNLEK
jgi:hypothetical protein